MGESYELLSLRVANVLEKYEDENVIFVCHEMVSKVMRGVILDLETHQILPTKHPQDTVYKIEDEVMESINVV